MKVWLQNKIVDARQARVSVFDHGFLYGDGIYETVRAYRSQVFHWPDHFKRLQSSARRIALRCPWSSAYLLGALQKVLKANRQPDASVRITIARGPGPLGLNPAVCPQPTLVMLLHPSRDLETIWRKGISIGVVRVRRMPPESLDPQIKSNNSLNTILAKMEAEKMGVFEGVLLNIHGDLSEGTTSNIFFVKGRRIHTPALSCGILEGVTRGTVITLARKEGWALQEGRYTPRDLARADEVFLSSTTLEIAPVVRVKEALSGGRKSFRSFMVGEGRPGAITRRLHELFRAKIHSWQRPISM